MTVAHVIVAVLPLSRRGGMFAGTATNVLPTAGPPHTSFSNHPNWVAG